MVDRDFVTRHLEYLNRVLEDLKRYSKTVALNTLKNDRDTQNMVVYAMYSTIQAVIDIGNHILAEEGMERVNASQRLRR